MKFIKDAIRSGSFLLNVEARDITSILRQTLDFVVARGVLPPERRTDVESALLAGERQPTATRLTPHTSKVLRNSNCSNTPPIGMRI